MKEPIELFERVVMFMYSIYPALFWQVVFYFYRDYKLKREFNFKVFILHVLITTGMAILTIKWISIFEHSSGIELYDDLKYFIIFLAGGFSIKVIETLDDKLPQEIDAKIDDFIKKKSSMIPKYQKEDPEEKIP